MVLFSAPSPPSLCLYCVRVLAEALGEEPGLENALVSIYRINGSLRWKMTVK